ncbi:MAG: diguanylate cyclase, partial [Cyanobacteria bacterium J06639_1]
QERVERLETACSKLHDELSEYATLKAQLERARQALERDIDRHRAFRGQHQQALGWMALQAMSDGAIVVDSEGRIDFLNRAAETLLGWTHDDARQRPVRDVFAPVDEASRQPLTRLVEGILAEGQWCCLHQLAVVVTRQGRDRVIEVSASPILTDDETAIGAIVLFRDASASQQQARQTQQLWHQAHHDALTGAINRRGLMKRLQTALDATTQAEARHVLCYLDLDGFKQVNDTCGHAAGDELLRQVSRAIQARVRATDTVARLGGDEFCVLLYGCSLARAKAIAESWRSAIASLPFEWNDRALTIGVSIGLSEIDASTASSDRALKAADAACYRAKRDGRNCIRASQPEPPPVPYPQPRSSSTPISSSTLGSKQRGDRAWIPRLERALVNNEFVLFGQDMLALGGKSAQRREILLRLQTSEGQYCMPMAFIPAAERYGLMSRIDLGIIRTAIARLSCAHSDSLDPTGTPSANAASEPAFAVNISGASLTDRAFWDALASFLDQHLDVCPQLCFEISEMVAIANLNTAIDFISTFKHFGCEFALDRFSGLCSFAQLRQLGVDWLKLDSTASGHSASHALDRAILSSSIHVSRALGLKTVVLRAEAPEAIASVKALGADYAQGYAVARPVRLTQMLDFDETCDYRSA